MVPIGGIIPRANFVRGELRERGALIYADSSICLV
jgi:hypothetical protein